MIVVDAGVLIAYFDGRDAHHAAASEFLAARAGDLIAANCVTLAESLVHAVAADRAEEVIEDYELLGVLPLDLPGESAAAMARVRAETALRMPDALVICSAERNRAALATTDERLARAARSRGLTAHLVA